MSYECVVHLSIHKWDTDGEDVKLPKTVKVDVTVDEDDSIVEIHQEAMDKASDDVGYCIESCTIKRIDF